MKRASTLLAGFVLLFGVADLAAQPGSWTSSSAYVAPRGRIEIGLFNGVRLGVTERLEVSTDLIGLLGPRLDTKLSWGDRRGWRIASRQTVGYPTPLLRLVAREGTGGLIPADSRVPAIVVVRGELLATRALSEAHGVTLGVALRGAVRRGAADMPTIDVPLIYPRTAVVHGGVAAEGMVRWDGRLRAGVSYGLESRLWWLSKAGHVALEETGTVAFGSGRRFHPFLQVRFIAGRYPFGSQRHLIPLAGFRWTVRKGEGRGGAAGFDV